MLKVVANAEGLATGVPLLEVMVAFSVTITDPVELMSAARAIPTLNTKRTSFMMGTKTKTSLADTYSKVGRPL